MQTTDTVEHAERRPVRLTETEGPTDWVQRARGLAPIICEWRDASERERHMPRRLFEVLRDAGFFAIALPRSLGGADVDDLTLLRVIEELSRQEGSVGWNVAVAALGAVIATYLPAPGVRDVYRNGPNTVGAGGLPPKGNAIRVEGGFRLSGRWTFASGCHHADWMLALGVVVANDRPQTRFDGRPDARAFFVPIGECDILDTWYITGLRGTGSQTFNLPASSFPRNDRVRAWPMVHSRQAS